MCPIESRYADDKDLQLKENWNLSLLAALNLRAEGETSEL